MSGRVEEIIDDSPGDEATTSRVEEIIDDSPDYEEDYETKMKLWNAEHNILDDNLDAIFGDVINDDDEALLPARKRKFRKGPST